MASYFDLSQTDVLAMIPDRLKTRSDIHFLATQAEAELIQHYTREPLDRRGTASHYHNSVVTGYENLTSQDTALTVYLRYYKADADELTTTDELAFKTAMRRAIAAFIKLKAAQEDIDPMLSSKSRGRRSESYRDLGDSFEGSIPRSVTKWLRSYDKRPRTTVI